MAKVMKSKELNQKRECDTKLQIDVGGTLQEKFRKFYLLSGLEAEKPPLVWEVMAHTNLRHAGLWRLKLNE
jgi:hypothetical protein